MTREEQDIVSHKKQETTKFKMFADSFGEILNDP